MNRPKSVTNRENRKKYINENQKHDCALKSRRNDEVPTPLISILTLEKYIKPLINGHKSMTVSAVTNSQAQCNLAIEAPYPGMGSSVLFGLFDRDFDGSGFEDLGGLQGSNSQRAAVAKSRTMAAYDQEEQGGDPENHGNGEWMTDLRWKAICSKLLSVSEEAISDVDLLTLLLSYHETEANARKLSAQLIRRFETFGNVVTARCAQITGTADIPQEMIDFFRLVRAAGTRLAREEISNRPILDAWDKLLTYLRSAMAHQNQEQFRVLFLDRRNVLIADEVQHRGTIDHTPVYPREVAKRALELDASAIIMAHNHPSNHPAPSKGDIAMTRTVHDTLERLGIVLHDHIIISRRGHSSFRAMGLLDKKAS